jgi:hypothetical protein
MADGTSGFHQRLEVDGIAVEFAVESQDLVSSEAIASGPLTPAGRDAVDAEIARLADELGGIDGRIDSLSNTPDRLDYTVAAASGVLAAVIDSLWVGELSFERAHEWGAEEVNDIVMKTARAHGYQGDDLAGAISKLEQEFPFAGDKATNSFGGGTIHHLRDWTHHPSPIGLIASIFLQFTGKAWGVAKDGQLSLLDVVADGLIGQTVPEKLLFGTVNWLLHLVSDVAGSSASAGAGTGLPGPLLSVVHEAGAALGKLVVPERQTEFRMWIEGAFRGSGREVPFDLRTELGLVHEFGRQALPVLLNEAIVRGFFFIRRAVMAIQAAEPNTFKQLLAVDLRPALPWEKNRTMARMLTIATSTFTAMDLADAAVRSALASGGGFATGAVNFALRVNFVGIARWSVAVTVDIHQEGQLSKERNARIALVNQRLHLLNARAFYKIGDMWIAADDAATAVQVTGEAIAAAALEFRSTWDGMYEDSVRAGRAVDRLRAERPALLASLKDDLDWSVD